MDAIVPHPGESWSSSHTPDTQRGRRAAIAEHGSLPAPDPAIFGLTGPDLAWVARRQTPHPGAVYDAPLNFDAHRVASVPRIYIDCTQPALATIAAARQRVRSEPGWSLVELATGHDAMISAPQALFDVLTGLA